MALLPIPAPVALLHQTPPALLTMATTAPTQPARIIVQKATTLGQPEAAVVQLGGVVIRDLAFINAFVAQVPAAVLPTLAARTDIRWISPDAPVANSGTLTMPQADSHPGLLNTYTGVIKADKAWQKGLKGQGITVAVVDSGITDYDDFKDAGGNLRILNWVQYSNSQAYHPDDYYGHGSHVAGVIGGNGALSGGAYIGVVPAANLLNVKITDDYGAGRISDVVAGLQWIYNNRAQYNIRVVNLSLNSSIAEPYHVSPLNAAVEILWFSGIVVVISAGNNGTANGGGSIRRQMIPL